MTPNSPPTITQLLVAWNQGDQNALEQLTPLVYRELHRLAQGYLAGERPDHVLQTTALVNEAYLKLQGHTDWQPEDRLHFFGVAARVMRQILVDHARARQQEKRGGGATLLPLDEAMVFSAERSGDLLALDEALNQLAARDRRKSRVVELRFFGGLTIDETASLLGVSFNTVVRDWEMARAWLYRYIQTGQGGADGS